MALYTGPDGQVDAVQLAEEVIYPSGNVGKVGEWVITCGDGLKRLCDHGTFLATFTQVYPRMVDENQPVEAIVHTPLPPAA